MPEHTEYPQRYWTADTDRLPGWNSANARPRQAVPPRRPTPVSRYVGFLIGSGVPGSPLLFYVVVKCWPVALGVLALVCVMVAVARMPKRPAPVPARAQPSRTAAAAGQVAGVVAAALPGSPEDLWLKRLSLELRLLGFAAVPHPTPAALAAVPVQTSAALTRKRTRLDIYVFGSAEHAESAALGLRLQPAAHAAERDGRVAIRRKDRVVLVARVDQGVVDDFEFEDVLTLAARQPPLTSDAPVSGTAQPASRTA